MPNIIETDVTIIGGGVVGAVLARELSRYELQVMVLEKETDVGFGTSKSNSGIVHSGIHDKPGTLKSRFCLAGNRLYPSLTAELDVPFQQNGTLIVARNPTEFRALDELYQNGRANGLTAITRLMPTDMLHLEPNLASDVAGGLLIPSGGIVMPFELVFGLIENAVANGVKVCTGAEVTGISVIKDGFLIETSHKKIRTRFVVNTAGLNSAKIAAMIGDKSFKISPRKGEEYLLDRRLEGFVKRTIFPVPAPNSKGILVIPTIDGNIMIGPTAQNVHSSSDLTTSSEGWQEVFQVVRNLAPGIDPSQLITSFAGLRAAADREDFIIEPSSVSNRFLHAAGIQSPGLTAAPAIGQYLLELLHDNGLELKPKAGFQPIRRVIRIRNLDRNQRASLIEQNPAYANIICRCELVSEAEIRAAIHRGANTLDGVKLRTRAGMGRCQGGFCTPKVIKILSEELNLPPTAITKNGSGSWLLAGTLRTEEDESNA